MIKIYDNARLLNDNVMAIELYCWRRREFPKLCIMTECVLTGYENPSVENGGSPQRTYEEMQISGGMSTDEAGQKLHEYPDYENQNAIERPIPPMELASYINAENDRRV